VAASPPPSASGVPRNARVIVAFDEPIDPIRLEAHVTLSDGSALPLGFELSPDGTMLSVHKLSLKTEAGGTVLDGVTFDVRAGEIVGIAGADALLKVNQPAEAIPYLDRLIKEFERSEYLDRAQKLLDEAKAAMPADAVKKDGVKKDEAKKDEAKKDAAKKDAAKKDKKGGC
jgi:hypothetical protein